MRTKTIKWWNNLPKSEEVNSLAVEGDNVVLIDGIAFLIQRKNDFNNVICWKVKNSKKDLVTTFSAFRAWCQKKKIQYIRIEGIGKHQYKMLYLVLRRSPITTGVRYAEEESRQSDNRHIWYVKTY
jgi:hypothetical protein